MAEEYENYVKALLEKSEEAYLMALEIVNKPTLTYRTEGFCFFICNAWELLLKAFIINQQKDITAINFKDKTFRTIGLSDCLEKVFTSTTDKVKTNLNHVITIRNRATHLVLPEYDYKFAPLFQQNITYYNRFFNKQFPDIPFNMRMNPFIAVSKAPKSDESSLSIIEDTVQFMDSITNAQDLDGIGQKIQFYVTKKASDADIKMKIDPSATENVRIVKTGKDVNILYPFQFKEVVKAIKESVEIFLGPDHGFSERSFNLISRDHPIKKDEPYCYTFNYSSGVRKYSQQVIDFVVYRYCHDEEFRNKYKKKGS